MFNRFYPTDTTLWVGNASQFFKDAFLRRWPVFFKCLTLFCSLPWSRKDEERERRRPFYYYAEKKVDRISHIQKTGRSGNVWQDSARRSIYINNIVIAPCYQPPLLIWGLLESAVSVGKKKTPRVPMKLLYRCSPCWNSCSAGRIDARPPSQSDISCLY